MAKSRSNKFIDTIDECLTNGVKNGIFQVSLEDDILNGRIVTINNRKVVNFGSCSYLGLEVDERLKQGAIDATIRYGTQYSSSRLFSACNLNEELEDLFFKMFDNNPSILAATTTLTHVSAIPILIQDDDLVILDHQVHGSVQLAVQLVKARGTEIAMIKHNRMDMLEDLIKLNPNKYNKIWYMADGLYSMYGDYAPLKDIVSLLDKYGNFHFYVDDAHGMSWTGKHGNGYVLSQISLHPKMVLSTSLAKGFGTGGGVLVLKDLEMRRKIFTCGSSYTYSGPVQPPMLGASIASAKIHLTDEIYNLQGQLKKKLQLTQEIIKKYELPLVLPSDNHSPIFYIALGLPRVGYNMVKKLLNEGFYTNIGIFPGVPVKCCGLRLAVTNGQTEDDIKNVLTAFAHHFPKVLQEEKVTIDDISNNFNMSFEDSKIRYPVVLFDELNTSFEIQHEKTIESIDKDLWNNLLADEGTFDWDGCRFLEKTFSGNPEPENNWNFHYIIIRDHSKKTILATFFTELLCKDDMIAPADISRQIEETRKTDKYYLVSNVIMMGSLLTLGKHLYIDRAHPEWKNSIRKMIEIIDSIKKKSGATMVQLRDFDTEDVAIHDFFIKEGFVRADMFDDHVIENLNWNTNDEFLNTLSHRSRFHQRKYVLKNQEIFKVEIHSKITESKLSQILSLYKQVKDKGFDMNTFYLPEKFFRVFNEFDSWEIIELSMLADPYSNIVGIGLCYKSITNNYIPMIIGLDYSINKQYGIYRQILFQAVKRAAKLKCKKLYFGFGADIEKHKFGTKAIKKSVYFQVNDNFNIELLNILKKKAINA
jgi:7-keto-8-aminopelargonate synthetase-like enzyme/predicted N-acyltransferase